MAYGTQLALKEVQSPHRAKVTLTKELVAQIGYLHRKCPKNTEWSGLLIWELVQGSLENLADLNIRCHAVFPMDFGDGTFTSFEGNDNWIKAFTQFPQIDPIAPTPGWYVNKIHSHHSMNVFHSGVDDGDIHTNTDKLPMFLSLIVNYACEADCKLAIAIETEETVITYSKWKLKGWRDKKKEFKKAKTNPKSIYIIHCDVEYEQDQWFKDEIVELAKSKVIVQPTYYNRFPVKTENYSTPTVQSNKPNHTYKRMLSNLADLFTLGTTSNMMAYAALQKLDADLGVTDTTKYQKALKYYFLEHWYLETFYNISCNEVEVIQEIESFMEYHATMWIYKFIKVVLNELKTECVELRAVQGVSVV